MIRRREFITLLGGAARYLAEGFRFSHYWIADALSMQIQRLMNSMPRRTRSDSLAVWKRMARRSWRKRSCG